LANYTSNVGTAYYLLEY